MSVLSPLWLWAVPVFVATAAWLLLGRRRRQWVPFLPLWRGPVRSPRLPQAMEPPPIYLWLALAGILAGILGASRPVLNTSAHRPVVNIVVDCGATMSVSHHGRSRYAELASALRDPIREILGPGPMQIVDIPRGEQLPATTDNWPDIAALLRPTGVRTRDAISASVAALLAQPGQTVIVLSDQHCEIDDPRLVQIAPAGPVEHVGIVDVAARREPEPQVMVRLRNDSSDSAAQLIILSTGAMRQRVLLGPRGSQENFFFDVPLGSSVQAIVSDADESASDHRAWAIMEGNSPRFEAHAALWPKWERIVKIYQSFHSPRSDAPAVALARHFSELPAGEAGIAWQDVPTDVSAAGPVALSSHPILHELTAENFDGASVATDAPRAAGWETILRIGGRPAVMARSTPQRQVWVGFDSPTWGTTPAYVIFWCNVFDWVSSPDEQYAWHPLRDWNSSWHGINSDNLDNGIWPGIYQRNGDALRAFNTLDLQLRSAPPETWREALRHLPLEQRAGLAIAPGLLLAAMVLLFLAALTWRSRESFVLQTHES